MRMNTHHFIAKAMCLFVHEGKLLLYENTSPDGVRFYRPPGGHIEHGEYAQHAVEREVREEIGSKIAQVTLWRVIENIFATKDRLHHEYVFCFTAEFVDRTLYSQKKILAYENGKEQILCWYSRDDITQHKMFVVPTGILDVVPQL